MNAKLQLVIADAPLDARWYWGVWLPEKKKMILFVEEVFNTKEACIENYKQIRQLLLDNPAIKLWRNTRTHEVTELT